jgi:hypothetical protein
VQVRGPQNIDIGEVEPRKSTSSRKTVLIYDSQFPEKSPRLFFKGIDEVKIANGSNDRPKTSDTGEQKVNERKSGIGTAI